jgi:hypothetical protein
LLSRDLQRLGTIQIDVTIMTRRCVVSGHLVLQRRFMWFTCFDASPLCSIHAILLPRLCAILLCRLHAIHMILLLCLHVIDFGASPSCDLLCRIMFIRFRLYRLHAIYFVVKIHVM